MPNQLTINFTQAPSAPSGYLIRYWETSTPGTVLTMNAVSSPAIITNLPGYSYTGTVEAVCSFGTSTRVNFTAFVCKVVFDLSTTSPTTLGGTNGTATIANIIGGSGTYTYSWNTSPVQTTITATGLTAGQTLIATVTDTVTTCVTTKSITVGQTSFTFDADYLVVTYQFTNGSDLDTRTRVVSIDGVTYADQNIQGAYIGYGQRLVAPQNANTISSGRVCDIPAVKPLGIWGNDNTNTGFESVMIDFTQLSAGQNEIVIDCRALWWGTIGSNPVNIGFTFYKGGCMIKQGNSGSPAFNFTNPTATSSLVGVSAARLITAYRTTPAALATGSSDLENPNVQASISRGQRLAVIKYNRTTDIGTININDTTTPAI